MTLPVYDNVAFAWRAFEGPSFSIVGGTSEVEYRWSNSPYAAYVGTDSKCSPSPEAWSAFWRDLDTIGVWEWRERYENNNVLDGADWELDVRHGADAVKSMGTNAYPPSGGNDPTPQFHELIRALGKLIGDIGFAEQWSNRNA